MNKQDIKKRLTKDGRTIASWAVMRGFPVSTVHCLLDGRIRPTGYAGRAILAQLRTDGYLVDEESEAA